MSASGGALTAWATTARPSRAQERSGVLAALVGHQVALHVGVDAPGYTVVTRRAGSSARSESANARSANLLAEYDANPGDGLRPRPS